MRVYDIYKNITPSGKPTRIAVVGSCRVTDPFEDLVRFGHAAAVARITAATHTLGETSQLIEWSRCLRDLPAAFAPMIFDTQVLPERPSTTVSALNSAEVVLMELSGLTQVRCGDVCFQLTYFFRQFVSRYGAALMPWYRVLSSGAVLSDELIDTTLSALSNLPRDEFETAQTIVRGTSLETWDVQRVAQGLATLGLPDDSALGIVTHFAVPGIKGGGMDDRHTLIRTVGAAAAMESIPLFNPSGLVVRAGREIALENGGKDIHHYAPSFRPVILHAMLNFADYCGRMDDQARTDNADVPRLQPSGTLKLAAQLNSAICEVCAIRVARQGIEGSGLYEHYNFLLSRKAILGIREIGLANLVLYSLPAFASYHVPRAGVGELPLLLAYEGLQVLAFEPNGNRRAAISDLVSEIKECGIGPPTGSVEIGGALDVPDSPVDPDALCIAALLPSTYPVDHEEKLLTALVRYSALIFDPRSLFRRNDTAIEQERCIQQLVALGGYTTIRPYPAQNVVFCSRPRETPSALKGRN
jgi:hypothetical protein